MHEPPEPRERRSPGRGPARTGSVRGDRSAHCSLSAMAAFVLGVAGLCGPAAAAPGLTPEPVLIVPLELPAYLRGQRAELQAQLAAKLLATGAFVESVSGRSEAALQECVRQVNSDTNEPSCWIRVGLGQGARSMVVGRVQGAAARCSLTLRLVHLEARVTARMHHATLRPCGAADVSTEIGAGASILAGSKPAASPGERSDRPTPGPVADTPAGPPDTRRPGPAGTVWARIEGGSFRMGAEDGEEDERPVHSASVSTFELMVSEVTVANYAACVQAGHCAADGLTTEPGCNWRRPDHQQHPLNCVDYAQAAGFCRWLGGRLPSEAEWEYAASAGRGRRYPWGNEPPSDDGFRANYDGYDQGDGFDRQVYRRDGWEETAPACSFPLGVSAAGICDLAGNVWEWVADAYARYGTSGASEGAPGGEPPLRVVRGGSWMNPARGLRTTNRSVYVPSYRHPKVGFRCAR